MNPIEIALTDVSPAFVVGVNHTYAQAFGERGPAKIIDDPQKPWMKARRLGPMIVQPGAPQFHPFRAGSEEENSYYHGRAYAAQRLQKELDRAAAIRSCRDTSTN